MIDYFFSFILLVSCIHTMALRPVLDRSLSEKANQFLLSFGKVSSILGLNVSGEGSRGNVFDIEDNINEYNNPDDVFIRIVTSLQMNDTDQGLHHLNDMARMSAKGDHIDKIIKEVGTNGIEDVSGLCKDVLRGMDYFLKNGIDRKYTDSKSVARSFVLYLDQSL